MKLKTLSLVLLLLVLLSLIAHYATRPKAAVASDSRLGQEIISADLLAKAAKLRLGDDGKETTLILRDGKWWVENYYGLPADASRLSQLTSSLAQNTLDRVVANPARLERLELTKGSLALTDAEGREYWKIDLGKPAPEAGGRYLRYHGETPAFLTEKGLSFDADPKNWADAELYPFNADEIARVELVFPGNSGRILASRAKKQDPYALEAGPEGRRAASGKISDYMAQLGRLRFVNTADPAADDVRAAREHAYRLTLTKFDGETLTYEIGRRPIDTKPAAEAGEKASPSSPTAPAGQEPALQAGPVYAALATSRLEAPLNRVMRERAFEVFDYTHGQLPRTMEDWLEPAASPPTPEKPAPTP